MKVLVQGTTREVNLTDKHFIAEGGEGKVYGVGDTIYKIYLDPSKMIPQAKMEDLHPLGQRKNILIPMAVLLDPLSKNPIGYTMDWLKDSVPLCKIFTNDFRTRFNIEQQTAVALVEKIAEDISFIHRNKCLMVDGNELNYLVDKKFSLPYFIDTDSWQTPHFPPTALMPSIKDWHTKGFNEGSDWFAFAIIATQLLVGIHPYKGAHPDFASIKMADRMTERMKKNISIFNPQTTVNAAVRPFDMIPAAYKTWLTDVLEHGKRTPPPTISGAFTQLFVKPTAVVQARQFVFDLLGAFSSPIIRFTGSYVITKLGMYPMMNSRHAISPVPLDAEVVMSDTQNKEILVSISDGFLRVWDIATQKALACQIGAEDKMVIGSSVFVKNQDKLLEITMADLGANTMPAVKTSYDILPNSTQLFNGLAYMNALGKHFLMIPYKGAKGQSAMYQAQFKELDGHQILEAKHDNRVTIINASNANGYANFIIKHSEDYRTYDIQVEHDVSYSTPNFVTLDNGICVRITEEDEVLIFSNRIDKPAVDVKKDPAISFEMKLYRQGMRVLFKKDNSLYHLKMK